MSTSPQFPGAPKTGHRQLVPGHATRFRPLYVPGASGAEIRKIGIASSDAAANTLLLGIAKPITAGADMGVGTFLDGGAGADTITRTAGSFATDGWIAGERFLALGSTTLANDVDALLTGVAALTLTFATGVVNTAEAFLTTTKLYRLMRLGIISVPLSAGYVEAAASISGLDATEMPMIDVSPDRYLTLGPDDILVCAAGTTLGASEVLDVTAFGADF